jgi:hypothetical protein
VHGIITEDPAWGRGQVQRQRNSATWTLPLCSFETSAAVLLVDRQCRSAMVCAAAISVSSEYQRRVIASGDRLMVQGGALQAAMASASTAGAIKSTREKKDTAPRSIGGH